ncbi:MAG: AAC(3) family N-acetyltransferase [Oscillospiraceae bacterium]|nr:AAC(3) family N-acetyltransferase [Oscillospiraceae bacterium]
MNKTKVPSTIDSIYAGLNAMGISGGDVLMVHSSLSALGTVFGAQEAVVRALLKAVGSSGTVVMPAFTWENDDPLNYENPPLPVEWHEMFRETMLPFDKNTTPVFVRGLGIIPEYFRTYPGTLRSDHPYVSFTANGKLAKQIVAQHALTPSQGMETPLGAIYNFGAKILLLGVDYDCCTAFHLAEALTGRLSKVPERFIMTEAGKRTWKSVEDYDYAGEGDFLVIGNAYERGGGVAVGQIGLATCKLFDFKPAVDFATKWLLENRSN